MMSALKAGFKVPHSIHPQIQLEISTNETSNGSCDLHALIRTNDKIFFDPYELEDLWSPNQKTATMKFLPTGWKLDPPVPDLERPVKYGFRLHTDSDEESDERVVENTLSIILHRPMIDKGNILDLVIPAHARYQRPTETGYKEIRLDTALVSMNISSNIVDDVDVHAWWACASQRMNDNEIWHDSLPIAISSHMSPTSHIYRLSTSTEFPNHSLTKSILLPAANPSHRPYVSIITLAVVLGCFAWIMHTLLEVFRRPETGRIKAD